MPKAGSRSSAIALFTPTIRDTKKEEEENGEWNGERWRCFGVRDEHFMIADCRTFSTYSCPTKSIFLVMYGKDGVCAKIGRALHNERFDTFDMLLCALEAHICGDSASFPDDRPITHVCLRDSSAEFVVP